MTGREDQKANDVFFVCALIESVARKTKNRRRDVARAVGRGRLAHYLELADVYHCEVMEKLVDEAVARHGIAGGAFDNVAACLYRVPTAFDIAKVYKRLIVAVAACRGIPLVDAALEVYGSWVSDAIDDYNSSFYYENPDYVFQSYLAGKPLSD